MNLERDRIIQIKNETRIFLNSVYNYSKNKIVNKPIIKENIPRRYRKNAVASYSLSEYYTNFENNERPPENYNDPQLRSQSELLYNLVSECVDRNARILEPGCNIGRNLVYLYNEGYTNLMGIDINNKALDILHEEHPGIYEDIDTVAERMEAALPQYDDYVFDLTFTMAAIKHIHPKSEFVFGEIARVTSDYIITVEDEYTTTGSDFPRNYETVFSQYGFEQVKKINGEQVHARTGMNKYVIARVLKRNDEKA